MIKPKKNASDILGFQNRLKQKEDTISENERGITFNSGMYHYLENSYLVYKCTKRSFRYHYNSSRISVWISKGTDETLRATPFANDQNEQPTLVDDGRMQVKMNGCYFKQAPISLSNNIINIYVVYQLETITSVRNTDFTIQNALLGSCKITKNIDTSKYDYEGYGICFDSGGTFTHDRQEDAFKHTTLARNAIIFGFDMSFSVHANNKSRNIYVIGDTFIQGIDDTTIYAEKNLYRNFTDPGKKFVLSLHYNGANRC